MSSCGRLGRRACEERAVKAPQPVSLKGLPASRRVLVWLMLVFANGQGRLGACEERAVKGRPGLPASRLS